jgi:hypothetical protein
MYNSRSSGDLSPAFVEINASTLGANTAAAFDDLH